MDLLKKRILQDGKCFEGGILKVDSFINHQNRVLFIDDFLANGNAANGIIDFY